MIEEVRYWDKEQETTGFDPDIESSFSQISRVFTRPLVTDNAAKNSSFTSWRGRLVSICYLVKLPFQELFDVVKNIFALIHITALLILETLNFPFSSSAREEFFNMLKALLGISFGLGLRPLAFALDALRLSSGAIIHPAFAIGVNG